MEETVRLPPGSAWAYPASTTPALAAVRHSYPLAVRDPSLSTAISLLSRSLPYAFARFAVLLVTSVCVIIWLGVAIGGAAWLGTHIASIFGWVWAIGLLSAGGYLWITVVRLLLHFIACGHVAVLTELVTKGAIGNGQEGMFAYGKRIVMARIGQESLLYGLNALVRGVVASIHGTLDWIADLLPIPGLEGIAGLLNIVLRGATKYLDKVIFSYTLARGDEDVWNASREGLVYYAQNARPVLKTAIWSVVLERVLTVALGLMLLIPAAGITLMLPAAMREMGGIMTVIVAVLIAGPLRAAFIQPLFLIMMMVRFHSCIEGQAIDAAWDARLSALSSNFRDLGARTAGAMGRSMFGRWPTKSATAA